MDAATSEAFSQRSAGSFSKVAPLLEALRARGLSPKSQNRYLYAVSGALHWALSRELIPGMPVVPRQSEGVGRIHYLIQEDQTRLIKCLGDNDFSDVSRAGSRKLCPLGRV